MGPKDLLDAAKIQQSLKTKRIGKEILVFETVASTNDIAAQYAGDPKNDGLVILAEEQTSGRGRGGNKWYTDKGQSVLCSIVLVNESLSAELLSLTAAVAVAEAISEQARIKWPNDIIMSGRKVAGILLESKQTEHGKTYVLGIGINCHQKGFPAELDNIATSIDIETGSVCDRVLLTRRLLSSIEHWIDTSHKKAQRVIERWSHLSLLLGQRVTVLCDKREFTGTCSGIDPEKGLILQLDSGGPHFFPAAQSSIAK
jgi:BirA family biotin operon repressor/biotin-[acetyl-CoA-carboxylase] ligase